jgi:bifunctional non-homologous end joining protein LigD
VPRRAQGEGDSSVELDGITVQLTNQERVVFPDALVAKRDVIAYYQAVASVMVPELAGRPLTIERVTKSVEQGGFYQKHWQKHYPAWLDSIVLGGKTRVRYPIVDTAAGLVYLANQGGIAFHVCTARKDAADRPDMVVFDLDPPDEGFPLARRVALLLRDVLADLALPAFVKTTGSKGLHVVTPLDGRASFEDVYALTSAITRLFLTRHPELVTTEFYKKDRGGRLFFDTGRNIYGATFVAAYSLRCRANASVSAPVTWKEVESDVLRPDGFTLRDIPGRLAAVGDPWQSLREQLGNASRALAVLA